MRNKKTVSNKINILLKKNISKAQLIGYAIANVIGLTVVLAGVLFFCDSHHSLETKDNYFSDDYIVVSKKVKGINIDPIAFTIDEINDLKNQEWIKKLGLFTSSRFPVSASVIMGGKGMSTQLFFESVPDDFFDTKPYNWEYDPSKKFIPIILNKDYLALYNFGFALPQGLPQLSEDIISSVPLKLRISGDNGKVDFFDAAIVGFSSRLNTIAVPQQFMDWANETFSPDSNIQTSRLILKIDKLKYYDIKEYLSSHGYEIGGDKEADSKVSEFLGIVSGVTSINGLIISLLALFILILSIFLLLQKSKSMLRNLLLLGYSPRQVGKYYEKTVIITNSLIVLISIGLTFICRLIWMQPLRNLGLGNSNILFMVGTALIYFIIITLINIFIIRCLLIKIWNNN